MRPVVKLPIGIEDFEEIRTEGFYYIDKTGLIIDLLNSWSKVNLFTRPRRFGKSLNMSMLKAFFSCGCDPKLFDGLSISRETALCEKYMGKFPVISITLNSVEANRYEDAVAMLCVVIGEESQRFSFLPESDRLSEDDKRKYSQLATVGAVGGQMFPIPKDALASSLKTLSALLRKHYGRKVILLIDEYDAALDKANQYGYYDDMAGLLRSLFGNALKTNENLLFAVLTGCLRVAKESIFTGLNNFKVLSITDVRFEEYFGFSDEEVKNMLRNYGLEKNYDMVREWYDGYRFGNTDIYCPWDVLNYVDLLLSDPDALPRAFWMNSSGNAILRTLLQKATDQTMEDLDQLVNGLSVTKKISEEPTYRELYDSIDNLWSVLFTTGYLTGRRKTDLNTYELAIPNQEIRMIFTEQILSWFQEEARKDTPVLDTFCEAFSAGDPATIERLFTAYLKKTISIRDTAARKEKKENFYHGILLGLLSHRSDWILRSNAESGTGCSDIQIRINSISMGIVIELKYSESRNLEAACQKALEQIEEKNYAEQLMEDDMITIRKYGIACRRNTCMVKMESS